MQSMMECIDRMQRKIELLESMLNEFEWPDKPNTRPIHLALAPYYQHLFCFFCAKYFEDLPQPHTKICKRNRMFKCNVFLQEMFVDGNQHNVQTSIT